MMCARPLTQHARRAGRELARHRDIRGAAMLVSVSVVTVGDSASQIDPVAEVLQRFADARVADQLYRMSTRG
jgi:hypothetical protein